MNYSTWSRVWSKITTVLYVAWGVLHLGLGVGMVVAAAGGGMPAGERAAESLMFFVCAAILGGQAIAVALVMNRRNSRRGFWLNLVPLGVVDVAFLFVLVPPGHVDLVGGVTGPVLWALAAAASLMAQRREAVTT